MDEQHAEVAHSLGEKGGQLPRPLAADDCAGYLPANSFGIGTNSIDGLCGFATAALLAALLVGCQTNGSNEPPLFERRAPSATGVAFANTLPEASGFNILNYPYYYNGGGVAAGDVNGDGLPDLYFTSNLEANRLYLNKGGLQFEDVTEQAGVAGTGGWTTGATMADVNGDGWLDLYVSVVNHLGKTGANQLFINKGTAHSPTKQRPTPSPSKASPRRRLLGKGSKSRKEPPARRRGTGHASREEYV